MYVALAVLADAANATADNRLNILGIFNEVRVAAFPGRHPMAVLVVSMVFRQSEVGQPAKVVIRFMDPDHALAEITGEFVVPAGAKPGDITINQIFHLTDLGFPAPGDYAFHILVNGDEKRTVSIAAVLVDGSTDES